MQLEIILQFMEYRFVRCNSSDYADALNGHDNFKAVLIGDGLERQAAVVKDVAERAADIPVILITDKGLQVPTPVRQILADSMEFPFSYEALNRLSAKFSLASCRQGRAAAADDSGGGQRLVFIERLKGQSQTIAAIRHMVAQVSQSDATVLILGESGTGKEVIARALHDASQRRARPFVPVNCGAIPGELLESELFGHEKGAFTGALTTRQGRFELAEGGTLFLDEIGDMPLPMQVKLLRVLQERTFERVGSNRTIQCDVRIVAATHRNLDNEIRQNRFREDLFYRLNVFPIEVPPLRERREDIPALIRELVARLETANRGSVRLAPGAVGVLMQHDWPGNVRELANLIERLAILYPKGVVDSEHLPEKFQKYAPFPEIAIEQAPHDADEEPDADGRLKVANLLDGASPLTPLPAQGIDLKEYLNVLEVDLIRQALAECNGVVAHAAKRLNMRRTTLVEKLRKYDFQRP